MLSATSDTTHYNSPIMKTLIATILALTAAASSALAQVAGDWNGTLDLGSMKLALVFHISEADGSYSAAMDSPDQGAYDIPAQISVFGTDSLHLSVPAIAMTYTGRAEGDAMTGKFTQGGMTLPLRLVRGERQTPNRPQTPKPPFPYSTEEVTFANTGHLPATLSGTLTLPVPGSCEGKPAVVVLVSGSGQQDRDETLFEHRPFAVIADSLARAGIATLRYDDRGCGKSTGNAKDATTADNADDAAAAVRWLRDSRRFSRVGILGHSEGGAIAFILAARGEADFIVTMGAPGLRGDSIVTAQVNRERSRLNMPPISVEDWRATGICATSAWLGWFADYDPAADIAATCVPSMVLGGEKDTQVPPMDNIGRIRQLLPEGDSNVIRVYPGLNHMMQPCETGEASEYRDIETTLSPQVLADIAAWLRNL